MIDDQGKQFSKLRVGHIAHIPRQRDLYSADFKGKQLYKVKEFFHVFVEGNVVVVFFPHSNEKSVSILDATPRYCHKHYNIQEAHKAERQNQRNNISRPNHVNPCYSRSIRSPMRLVAWSLTVRYPLEYGLPL